MANWEVTKTTKHGRPIEEHTAKIGKDQWKIESMPHISPNFGSLNRWDDLRGLRQISTGNIEMLKRQAEAISTKKDAVSDLLRGFSRPGAPDTFAVEDKDEMGTNKRIIRAGGHEFLAEDEGNRTRISIKIDGVWEHATTVNTDNQTATEWIEANVKPGHPRRWLPYAFSRPGVPDTFAVEDRFYFGKGRKERFASISIPRQSVTSGASGTWKKREVTVRGKKAWLVELHRGGVLVGYLNQHPDTRQFHAFDGNTDQQIGVGGEAEMKRLVESL